MKKKRKERKINLIKALKHENAILKHQPVKPLRIYESNLKHQRAIYRVDNRFILIAGVKEADKYANFAICNQISKFLRDGNIKKAVNRGNDTTEYIFDFWVE